MTEQMTLLAYSVMMEVRLLLQCHAGYQLPVHKFNAAQPNTLPHLACHANYISHLLTAIHCLFRHSDKGMQEGQPFEPFEHKTLG